MINNVVRFYSGYIQIQEEQYWDHKSLYYSFDETETLDTIIRSIEEISMVTPRLESFALLSATNITQTAAVIGIDPIREDSMTGLSKWITRGQYFSEDPGSVLLAEKLAKNLGVDVKDTIVFLSQGFYGNTVAAEFTVSGILKFPNPELNKAFSYMKLTSAQEYFSAYGKLTSIALMIPDYTLMNTAMRQLESKLDSPYIAKTWKEMQPEMVQMIESDRAGGVVMKAILYIIIGFGILGTIMMMISERKKEFGLMVAIGMQKHKLARILFFETVFIGLIGVISGITASLPIIHYFIQNPVPITGEAARAMVDMGIAPELVFTNRPGVFINQFITVLLISLAVSIYPVANALCLNETKNLKA